METLTHYILGLLQGAHSFQGTELYTFESTTGTICIETKPYEASSPLDPSMLQEYLGTQLEIGSDYRPLYITITDYGITLQRKPERQDWEPTLLPSHLTYLRDIRNKPNQYILLEWPDYQEHQEEPWFDEEAIYSPDIDAYFIPEFRLTE